MQLNCMIVLRGLFESMIFSDLIKQRCNVGLLPNIYFWRDNSGNEVDCIFERGLMLTPIEIKSGETLSSNFFANIVKWNLLSGNDPANSYVIYGGKEKQIRSQGTALGWLQLGFLPIKE